jgi:CubicO group peptidase (beta-lactamase class C family)
MTNALAARVEGHCDAAFLPVRALFERSVAEGEELGASLAVEIDGRPVIDLWGGWADAPGGTPWRRDTVCVVFSNTKPATALCAHQLAEAGELDLDRPVAHYWPAFAAEGKQSITPRMLLDHSAGLPALRAPLAEGDAFDWARMTGLLARERPFWAPGTRVGYHALTFGWLVGELVRRLSGQLPGDYFRDRIADPLGLDFWIGLPESEEPRVARIAPPPPLASARNAFEHALLHEPQSPTALYMKNTGGWRPSGFNSRAGRAAGVPAAGGVTHARSLARLYGTLAMGGARGTTRVLREDTLARAVEVSAATHDDACLRVPTRFGAGFMRQMDNRATGQDSACIGADAFGHVGAGGSLGIASPARRLGLGYVMNRMGPGVLLNERAHRLVDAVHACIDQRPPSMAASIFPA